MAIDLLIEECFRLTKIQRGALKKLGLLTTKDLLFYFPIRYGDVAQFKLIHDLQKGDYALVYGRINKLEKKRGFRKKIPMTRGVLEDATGKLSVVWFHQPYIAEMLKPGQFVALKGKISAGPLRRGSRLDESGTRRASETSKYELSMINPDQEESVRPEGAGAPLFERRTQTHKGKISLWGVYPETKGITSRWFHYTIKKILAGGLHEQLEAPLPDYIRKRYHLPQLSTALV